MQVSSAKQTLRKKKESELDKAIIPFLKANKDKEVIHKLFSYPAKFQANLPESIIKTFTNEGDLILDPFSGGGTTSAEAIKQGRSSFAMDLNPISIIVSRAKTTKLSAKNFQDVFKLLENLERPRTYKFLNKEEVTLLGKELADFAEAIAIQVKNITNKKYVSLITTVAIKRIKLATRRDKEHLRKASFSQHIDYIADEIEKVSNFFLSERIVQMNTSNEVVFGSNHEIPLQGSTVKMIITSPPYPGVDIEYNLIQLQRRDLNRCYRSDIAQRLCEIIVENRISPTKKDLCNGGSAGTDYWFNAKKSLQEMFRVLKKDGLCFLYIGFKDNDQPKIYEKIIEQCGFRQIEKYDVELGHERVASSRGTFHGRETKMMKSDILYVLRK